MFRRYNRWWSRFDQPDPYDGSYDSSNPQSFNRYAYVQNDPVNFVDPAGLDPQDPLTPPTITHTDPESGDPVAVPGIYAGIVTATDDFAGGTIGGSALGMFGADANQRVAVINFQELHRGSLNPNIKKLQQEWDDAFDAILDEQYACFDRAGAEKERQWNERIGATATERLKKVYNGVIPDLNSIGPGALGAIARALGERSLRGAIGGFGAGVGFKAVWNVWKNSIPLFIEWAKIDKDWWAARMGCTDTAHRAITALGPRPRDPSRRR